MSKTRQKYIFDEEFVGPVRPGDNKIDVSTETYDGVIAPSRPAPDITPTVEQKPMVPGASKPITPSQSDTVSGDLSSEPAFAPSTTADSRELTGSEKYEQMYHQYMEEYLGRDPFEYDVDADEIYKIYRDQALKSADRARRDTVAQAAGLTGGYGSSYAAAAGSNAYNDIVSGVDDIIPELYDAAYSRYVNDGNALRQKATDAAGYASVLKQQEAADKYPAGTVDVDAWNMEQKMKTTAGLNDYKGENDTGATLYDEVMRIYAGKKTGSNSDVKDKYVGEGVNKSLDEIRAELMSWQYDDADGKRKLLSYDEVEYLVNSVATSRLFDALSNMVATDGTTLGTYMDGLEGKPGEEIWSALEAFTDKSGEKLTEDEISLLITMM